MTVRDDFLARFDGSAGPHPLYVPDLTLWYQWHHSRGTLPAEWQNYTLVQIARALGVPAWVVVRPWRMETAGVSITTEEADGARTLTYQTASGVLTARWTLGPDGDWWQTEYPVKSGADLAAARELIDARAYTLDAAELVAAHAAVGEDGVVAIELPMRPYSEVLHALIGWSEGLMLLMGEEGPAILELATLLEARLQELVAEIAALPGVLVLAPDNLDGQFISPGVFREHLAASYEQTAATLHAHGKRLIVHVGGPVSRLLPLLAAAGVDGVEGVSGPPQGDATLAAARALAGPQITLWGGIPQDFLLAARSQAEFEEACASALAQAANDPRAIVGIADRVPVGADRARLQYLAEVTRRRP